MSHARLSTLLFLVLLQGACGSESKLAEARSLQEAGNFAASIPLLESLLEVDADLPEANYRLGAAFVQTGEPSRAVWPLEKAAESSDYAISGGVLLASTHFRTRNYDEAIRAAGKVLALDPERDAALRIRANARLSARQLDAALEDASRLVERYPTDYGVRALHATILGELGRLEEAEREHAKLKELGDASDDPNFRDRTCLAPGIFAQEVKKDLNEAAVLYEECAARGPTEPLVVHHLVAFFDLQGDTERGSALWRNAVEAAPDVLALRQGLATRLEALGESESAERVLRESIEHFDSAEAWRALANFYRIRRDSAQALAAIERVIERSGDEDDALRFVQADLLIDLSELDRARQVTESLDQQTYAHLLRGRIELVSGNPGAALEHFDRGIRAWPNNASARFLAGIAARDLGDTERALSELREAVRAGNTETDAALELSRLLLASGQDAQALTFANLALRGRNGALRPEPYTLAVRALTRLGQPERARASIQRMEALGFDTAALRERVWLAGALDGPAAVLEVAEASGVDLADPALRDLHQTVVEAERSTRGAAAALARLDAALQRFPKDASLFEQRGRVLLAEARNDEARIAFESALAQDSERAAAHAGLAELRRQAGDLQGALSRLDRAAALSPDSPNYAYAAAQLLAGSGREAEAEQRLRRIVRHHPGASAARNDLAWLLADQGRDLDSALEFAEQAARIEASPTIDDTLGWVHFQRGDFGLAVEALERAVAEDPNRPSVLYRLGLALQKSGDTQRARQMFERALAEGTFPEATRARQQLAALGA